MSWLVCINFHLECLVVVQGPIRIDVRHQVIKKHEVLGVPPPIHPHQRFFSRVVPDGLSKLVLRNRLVWQVFVNKLLHLVIKNYSLGQTDQS